MKDSECISLFEGVNSFYNITNSQDEMMSRTSSPWYIKETNGTVTVKGPS